ncbi:MAG: helix-turn-helix transcriptional regulator, partial [Alphaproteobacteria bacterium]
GCAIGLADMNSPDVQIQTGNSLYSKGFLEDYNRRFQAENIAEYQHLFRFPAYSMIRDTEILSGEEVPARERPTLDFLYQRFGIAHRAAARLNRDGAWIGGLTLQHLERHGPMTDAEATVAGLFLPHIAKTVELTRPFMVLKSRFQAVMAVLDRFHVGVFILSTTGHTILHNREADRILDLKDGLSLDRSRQPRPARETERRALRDAILKAAATAGAEGDRAETLLALPRLSGHDPFLAEVVPIRGRGIELDSGFTGAMMLVIDPMHTDVVSTEGMRALYNLTGAESDTCRLIAEGLGTGDIADTQNLTRETVRTYVKRILEKTGTRNRVQLVRLALTVNLPIDELDGKADAS